MTTTISQQGTDRAAFDAFLDRVRAGARAREANRTLLHAEIEGLRALGFASWRLPPALGGAGLGFEELIARVVDLATADASLGHLVRGHIAFVEQLMADGLGTRPATERERRWVTRLISGELIGNAQSERQETAVLTTRLEVDDAGVLRLTGTKYYTTGSIYADWIHLAALDGDERVAVTVDARQPGVRSLDDWDGFGQLLTGSGTTTFDRALVDPADVERSTGTPGAWTHLGIVFQLVLLAAIAGIARTALEDAVAYVRPRRRTFGFAGETPPGEDPLVQQVVGRLSSVALSARELVLAVARRADAALEGLRASRLDAEDLQPVLLDVYRVQQIVPPLVLQATTELFEVGGASAVSRTAALDRHWRNVRTIASHNPAAQRARALGQFELLGTLPAWSAPGAPREPETTR